MGLEMGFSCSVLVARGSVLALRININGSYAAAANQHIWIGEKSLTLIPSTRAPDVGNTLLLLRLWSPEFSAVVSASAAPNTTSISIAVVQGRQSGASETADCSKKRKPYSINRLQ